MEIKFRRKDIDKVMRRLDPNLKHMYERLSSSDLLPAARSEMEAAARDLEDRLAPAYHPVALLFADLHDTPGRMERKGVIAVCVVVVFFSLTERRNFICCCCVVNCVCCCGWFVEFYWLV